MQGKERTTQRPVGVLLELLGLNLHLAQSSVPGMPVGSLQSKEERGNLPNVATS